MKLKYAFYYWKEGEDKYTGMPIGRGSRRFNGCLHINESSVAIMRLLEEDTTFEQVVAGVKKAYPDCTDESIREAVSQLLEGLKMNDLLEE